MRIEWTEDPRKLSRAEQAALTPSELRVYRARRSVALADRGKFRAMMGWLIFASAVVASASIPLVLALIG